MPRIIWEESHDANVQRDERIRILHELRVVVAMEVTRFDPSFALDWEKHTVTDISARNRDAEGDKNVMVTVRGMNKPDRVDHAKEIGDEIRRRISPLFNEIQTTWSLSLCWDEYYYEDEDPVEETPAAPSMQEAARSNSTEQNRARRQAHDRW